MSLTHGHYYAAMMIQETFSFDSSLKGILERNRNEYLIGAVGPDIVYWSDFVGDYHIYNLNFKRDIHEDRTGEMIQNLLRDYKLLRERSGAGEEPILAFILGWITHWVTDIYIHTLVDMYGGRYGTSKPKHIQLELVETKHICETKPLLQTLLRPNDEVFKFLAGSVARTYPEARIKIVGDPVSMSVRPDERTDWFAECMSYGLSVINYAYTCANEACASGTDSCSAGLQKLAKWAWWMYEAYIPSTVVYNGIMHPLTLTEMTAAGTSVTAALDVGDSGLYGKFLVDYKQFIAAAIKRGSSVFTDIDDYMARWFPVEPPKLSALGSRDTGQPPRTVKQMADELSQWAALERLFTLDGKDINILEPESFMEKFDHDDIMRIVRDGTMRDNSDTSDVCLELEYRLADGKSEAYCSRTKIEATEQRNIFGSRAGKVYLNIPVANPDNVDYSYTLKVSLTDEKAFAVAAYRDWEFIVSGENFYKADRRPARKERVSSLKVGLNLSAPWKVHTPNATCGGGNNFDICLIAVIPEGIDQGVRWRPVALVINGNINTGDPSRPYTAEEYARTFSKSHGSHVSLVNAGSLAVGKLRGVYTEGRSEAKSQLRNTLTSYYYVFNASLQHQEAWIEIRGSVEVEVDTLSPDAEAAAKARFSAFEESIREALKGITFTLEFQSSQG